MKVTIGRLKHAFRVAEKMKQAVENRPELCSASSNEMFLLGYLHDVGYSFVDKQEEHECAAGNLLKEQGYKFWQEVYYHGVPDCDYKSNELSLLNWADMTVNQMGEDVTIKERLYDIGIRYGLESIQYINAFSLCNEIQRWVEEYKI